MCSGRLEQKASRGLTVQALTKRELIEHVAKSTSFNQADTKKVVDTVFEAIVETVSEGEKVTIPGFGTFEPRSRSARMGRNPRTGEALEIKAAKLPGFVAGKAFKDAVNGNGEAE
jgi:DNA-binding protein HU-beta